MISSGEIWLDSRQGKFVVNYRMNAAKLLVALGPLAVLSFGILQAENLTAASKAGLIAFFAILFLVGNYLITAFRVRRWAVTATRSLGPMKDNLHL